MEYPKFRVGDKAVVLASAKEVTVTAFSPDDRAGYYYTYDDNGVERTRPAWCFADPKDVAYCVVEHEVNDGFADTLRCKGAYRKREDAEKRLNGLADEWLSNLGDSADEYEQERDSTGFSIWRDGYYNDEHYTLQITACELE